MYLSLCVCVPVCITVRPRSDRCYCLIPKILNAGPLSSLGHCKRSLSLVGPVRMLQYGSLNLLIIQLLTMDK